MIAGQAIAYGVVSGNCRLLRKIISAATQHKEYYQERIFTRHGFLNYP